MRTHILYLLIALFTATAAAQAADLVGTLPGDLSVDNKGAANYTIPIEVIPGRLGMQPDLAISYNSGAGNGLLGVGFSLSGQSSISRGRSILARDGEVRGIEFDTDDKLYLDGKRLILLSGTYLNAGSTYRTEVESFSRITAVGSGSTIDYFKVEEKGGRILYYGKYQTGDEDALHDVINPTDPDPVLSWALKRVEDRSGNYMTYEYDGDSGGIGQHLLKDIEYTHHTSSSPSAFANIHFEYETRSDVRTRYMGGSRETINKRLDKIQVQFMVSSTYTTLREYDLTYETTTTSDSNVSRLVSIQYKAAKDSGSAMETIPVTTFTWSDWDMEDQDPEVLDATLPEYDHSNTDKQHFADVNGDGLDDLVYFDGSSVKVRLSDYGGGFQSATTWLTIPSNFSYLGSKMGDFNGDGMKDLLSTNNLETFKVAYSTGGIREGHS